MSATIVLGAEIQHLLGFGNAADQRAGEASALHDQAEYLQRGCGVARAPTSAIVPPHPRAASGEPASTNGGALAPQVTGLIKEEVDKDLVHEDRKTWPGASWARRNPEPAPPGAKSLSSSPTRSRLRQR